MSSAASRPHARVTLAVLSAAVLAYTVLQSLVIPVLPTIQHDLHTSQTTVTWVLTAYLVSASVCTPIVGRIGDMFGKRRILIAALGGLAVGSLLAAIAPSIGVMIAARVIQGIGGGVLPLSFGIVRDEYPHEKVPGAVGILASMGAAGTGVGVVLAGPIINVLDYHWLFWSPLVLTLAAAAAAYIFVPESPERTPGRISWAPALLLPAWLVSLLIAVSEAPQWGWGSLRIVALFVAAAALAVGWVRAELGARTPLIDMRMMRLPAVWTTNVVALLAGVSLYSELAFVPRFVQTPRSAGYGFGLDVTGSGLIMLPQMITMFAIGFSCGRLVKRWGAKEIVVLGSFVSVVSMLMLTFLHANKPEFYVATAIQGVGFGLVFAAMSFLIVASVPQSQTGVASGMNANIRTIGGSIGAALMASILAAHLQASGLPREVGYTIGFGMFAAAAVLATLIALIIPTARETSPAHAFRQPEAAHPELAVVPGGTVVGFESE